MSNQDYLDAFDKNLARLGRAPATREKYIAATQLLVDWAKERPLCGLKTRDLDQFLDDWYVAYCEQRERPPAPDTSRNQTTAVVALYKFLDGTGRLVNENGDELPNPAARLERPARGQKPIDILTTAEDQALLNFQSKRAIEQFVPRFLRYTGLRVGEAVGLTQADVDLTGRQLHVRKSKTNAGLRTIPLNPELVPYLEAWLARWPKDPRRPLLSTRYGTPMHDSYVWRVVKRVSFKAGIRPVTCTCGHKTLYGHADDCPRSFTGEHLSEISSHTLRRTYGSDLLNRGMPIAGVSKLLGHSSVKVTQDHYAQLRDDTVNDWYQDAINRSVAA